MTNDIDHTVLVNRTVGKSWTCPHCKHRNKSGECADEILMGHLRLIQQCGYCGYLHSWELQITDDMKRRIVDAAIKGATDESKV